ncbi:MAG: ABC transporter ATP-binding protein [Bacteroidales bacterium]|jgi:ABC-2 type transport system ATP-binding protein|nr:ABC transporter ATP-binding protein [Bacteroidales bacterium]
MIKTNDLSFKYSKGGSPIFDNLNIEIGNEVNSNSNICGLLGENGVGKTTFLRLLSGLLFPKQGKIEVNGFNPRNRSAEFLSQIYYFPENIESIEKNIQKYAEMYAPFYPDFSRGNFEYCLSEFGVNPHMSVNALSHGNRKKALLSFALACNTPVLLLDEPTNGLDIPSKTVFRRLLLEFANNAAGKTIIISTHQVREVEDIIDPIIIMEYNRILLNNSVKEIKEKFSNGALNSALNGALSNNAVLENDKLNLEALFNMAIENKAVFENTFLK